MMIAMIMAVLAVYGQVDGDCNWPNNTIINTTDFSTNEQRFYHCSSLFVSGNIFVVGQHSLVIRVDGDVIIQGIIDITGDNGSPGLLAAGSLNGGAGGSGGYDGGGIDALNADGNDGEDGEFGGGGRGGQTGITQGNEAGGGGGSGGRLGDPSAVGDDGTGTGIGGRGGETPQAPVHSEEMLWENVIGGRGGGAGGAGDFRGAFASGGSGGGGGGGMAIYALGTITLRGTIDVQGGVGGDGAWRASPSNGPGGGGGGGSGGIIHLVSNNNIIIDGGSLNASGGQGGTGGNDSGTIRGGDGSDGGDGKIRLEDPDGRITEQGATSIIPQAEFLKINKSFESDIAFACGHIDDHPHESFFSLIMGFLLALLILIARRLPRKNLSTNMPKSS